MKEQAMSREQIVERVKSTHAVRTIVDTEKQRIVFLDDTQTAVGRALRAAAVKAGS